MLAMEFMQSLSSYNVGLKALSFLSPDPIVTIGLSVHRLGPEDRSHLDDFFASQLFPDTGWEFQALDLFQSLLLKPNTLCLDSVVVSTCCPSNGEKIE